MNKRNDTVVAAAEIINKKKQEHFWKLQRPLKFAATENL